MLKYAITDRKFYGGNRDNQLNSLVREAARWALEGIDFIQVREKDLNAGELAELVRWMMTTVQEVGGNTKVLVNSRVDVAIATGADGVHLTATEGGVTPAQVREVYGMAGLGIPVVSISCHTLEEVQRASAWGVDAILFGPVYGKTVKEAEVAPGVGLNELRAACEAALIVPVFALGGVTAERAADCLEAGAAGVAGIRLFHPQAA